jgi:hypothetical protein
MIQSMHIYIPGKVFITKKIRNIKIKIKQLLIKAAITI